MRDMKKLLQDIVENLVEGNVEIKEMTGKKLKVFEIKVETPEVAKVIGSRGSIIKALKTIFMAIGARNDVKVIVDVVNPKRKSNIRWSDIS